VERPFLTGNPMRVNSDLLSQAALVVLDSKGVPATVLRVAATR